MNFLKNTFFLLIAVLSTVLTVGCKTIQYVPVETVREVRITDTTYLRDTLIRIELEKARLADFVDLGDTLVLQTDLARSVSFLDTTSGKLKGTLENTLKYVERPVQIRERLVYRDSLVTKEVPVEVDKPVPYTPKVWKVFGILGMLAAAAVIVQLLRKLKIIQL